MARRALGGAGGDGPVRGGAGDGARFGGMARAGAVRVVLVGALALPRRDRVGAARPAIAGPVPPAVAGPGGARAAGGGGVGAGACGGGARVVAEPFARVRRAQLGR